MRVIRFISGISVVVLTMATQATATAVNPVPEVDAGSISAGLGLLAGGILLARARWRSR